MSSINNPKLNLILKNIFYYAYYSYDYNNIFFFPHKKTMKYGSECFEVQLLFYSYFIDNNVDSKRASLEEVLTFLSKYITNY